jgi:SagB-type dehydrogenase family enzyme
VAYYRRADGVVSYWRDSRLVLHNYMRGRVVHLAPESIQILDFFGEWRTESALIAAWKTIKPASIRRAVRELVEIGLLDRAAKPPRASRAPAVPGWEIWNPAAGLFHFSTRDMTVPTRSVEPVMKTAFARMGATPRPPLFKRVSGARAVSLSRPSAPDEFARVLLARRTWRRFARAPLSEADIGTLLWLTWGVHAWGIGEQGFRFALRTSPSGGGLQPLEAYVLVLNVRGLTRGFHHYDPVGHRLTPLAGGVKRADVRRFLAGQWWFESAAAIVFMAAVFPRTRWKYRSPHAYRTILTEAGHFAQTFCLTATWLGLAPFCSQALGESAIESACGIDGVDESVVYAAGVGRRPVDGRPGQWPDHDAGHPFRPPSSRRAV